MGSFAGHALPGSYSITIGLWWWINVLRIYAQNLRKEAQTLSDPSTFDSTFKSTTWFPIPFRWLGKAPSESFIKIILMVLGLCLELALEDSWVLMDENGDFVEEHLNNYAHSAMYVAFMISFIVEVLQFYNVVKLPSRSEHVFLSIALSVEGFLFYFHLDGRPKLDQQFHVLLYVIIFIAAFVLLLEAWTKDSFWLLVVRVYLGLIIGTWFFQIAYSLHGTNPWKNTRQNQEFVVIAFAWHVVGILLFAIVGFIVVSLKVRCCKFLTNTSRRSLEGIEVQNIGGERDPEKTSLIDEDGTIMMEFA